MIEEPVLGARLQAFMQTPPTSTTLGLLPLVAMFTLPRTDPGKRRYTGRQISSCQLGMVFGGDSYLPYGVLPRLALAWVSAEAVRTQQPDLDVRHSLDAFLWRINVQELHDLEDQLDRLFSASISLECPANHVCLRRIAAAIADTQVFYSPTADARRTGRGSIDWVRLDDRFFEDLLSIAVPLDLDVLRAMSRSALGLDLYQWLEYWLSGSAASVQLSWAQLHLLFGVDLVRADEHALDEFRADVLRELLTLKGVWPKFDYRSSSGGLELHRPVIPPNVPGL